MDLISINTPVKYENALLAIQQSGRNTKVDKYWTSGTDIFSEDNFFWVSNGEAFDYEPWHNHQPDNGKYGAENCVELKWWNDVYKLNDNNCDAKIYFICSSVDIDVSCQFNLLK